MKHCAHPYGDDYFGVPATKCCYCAEVRYYQMFQDPRHGQYVPGHMASPRWDDECPMRGEYIVPTDQDQVVSEAVAKDE